MKIQFPWASIDGDVNVVSLLEAALGIFSVVTRQLLVGCAVELLFFFLFSFFSENRKNEKSEDGCRAVCWCSSSGCSC